LLLVVGYQALEGGPQTRGLLGVMGAPRLSDIRTALLGVAALRLLPRLFLGQVALLLDTLVVAAFYESVERTLDLLDLCDVDIPA